MKEHHLIFSACVGLEGIAASGPASSQHTSAAHDRAFGTASGWGTPAMPSAQKQGQSVKPGPVHVGPLGLADRKAQQEEAEVQEQQQAPRFIKAKSFAGGRAGYVFKKGPKGLGYYAEGKKGSVVGRSKQAASNDSAVPQRDEQQVQQPDNIADSDEDMQPTTGLISPLLLCPPHHQAELGGFATLIGGHTCTGFR